MLIFYTYIYILQGSYSFYHCSSLSQIAFTNGLTAIGQSMFYMGGEATLLSLIVIPSTITSIGFELSLLLMQYLFN